MNSESECFGIPIFYALSQTNVRKTIEIGADN